MHLCLPRGRARSQGSGHPGGARCRGAGSREVHRSSRRHAVRAAQGDCMVTKERFAQGMTPEQYLDQMGTNKDSFVKFLGDIKIRPEDKKALESLGKKLKLMVITEDWCGDALYNVPVLFKLAEGNPS